jgi:glycosyltransferase involved in cell wall biosynthesis
LSDPATPRLKVAIVAPTLGILGGQAVQANRLLEGWRDDPDVDAWLVPINPAAPRLLRALQRIRYLRTAVTQACYWPLLLRELRRADVVHVFSASYFSFVLAPWPAVLVARALGKPVVLNYHSGEAADHLRRSALARRTLGRVGANVVPSRFLVDVFAGFGIPATAIPNVIDCRRFRYRERRPLAPRLVSTRSFEPHYNVACTLRAFQRVQAQQRDATLTLAGTGSQLGELRALAASLRLRNVTFLGAVPPDQMPDVYDAADVFVQTPDIDNMPLSLLEAYATGTPVVSTSVGGVPAMLRDGREGLLVPPGDHEATAAAVLRLLADAELASRLARSARAACEAYTWNATRDRWLEAYRSLLPRTTAAGAPVHAS